MSRFRKLTQTIWYCQYHIVWVSKYRYRELIAEIAYEVENCVRSFFEQKECEIIELNLQIDHVHLLVMVPPKISISDYVGMIKGRTAIRVFNRLKKLKSKYRFLNYFGQHWLYIELICLISFFKANRNGLNQ